MRPLSLPKVIRFFLILSILGFFFLGIGIYIGPMVGLIGIIIGWIILICAIVFLILFYRCPHCQRFLTIWYHNHYCPHCRHPLD